jgi:ABC-type antimicrobial peptide transport system permease subunit
MLFGLSPADPYSYAAAFGLLALVGALASALPARRASRIEPNVALKID